MKLDTKNTITWCPGCPNYKICEAAKLAIFRLMKNGYKQKDFAMVTGIGCHAKIFDYLNIGGIYGLHGRVLPTALGIKLGNPNLHVLGFAGDGDTYAEGISHFIHACRYNNDMTLIVHDNRSFSLTTGQGTPTSQSGYKSKAEPLGLVNLTLNPIKLALVSGASFVARCNARNVKHTAMMIEKAIKHKGFSFVEILQDCIVFNLDINNLDKNMYKVENKNNMKKAMKLADKWNYDNIKGKIPIGILYQARRKTLDENWPQLVKLKKKKVGWKRI